MPDEKVVDDSSRLPNKRGNGILRREIWVDGRGKVTRYNLAYINPLVHHENNGRVLGYDNTHGYHHRHCLGEVTAVNFVGFEDIEDKFQADWLALRS